MSNRTKQKKKALVGLEVCCLNLSVLVFAITVNKLSIERVIRYLFSILFFFGFLRPFLVFLNYLCKSLLSLKPTSLLKSY